MKGIIDQYGCLVIERKSGPAKQSCPYSNLGELSTQCGDHCPHFDDDLAEVDGNAHVNLTCGNYTGLPVSIEILEDQRPVKKEEEAQANG